MTRMSSRWPHAQTALLLAIPALAVAWVVTLDWWKSRGLDPRQRAGYADIIIPPLRPPPMTKFVREPTTAEARHAQLRFEALKSQLDFTLRAEVEANLREAIERGVFSEPRWQPNALPLLPLPGEPGIVPAPTVPPPK